MNNRPSLPERAVVADDDEFFRLALASLLTRQLGFSEVIEAGSLDEALERLDQLAGTAPVTLALFDLSMPGMRSASSLGAVRECYPGLRVAVVSASTERRDILQALEAGVHGYVPKASGASELCRALDLILSGHIFVPPVLADIAASGPSPARTIGGGERSGAAPSLEMPNLTTRQREVLALLVQGRSNKEIARALGLGEGTVKVHVAALLRSFGAQNRAAVAAAGARLLDQDVPPNP